MGARAEDFPLKSHGKSMAMISETLITENSGWKSKQTTGAALALSSSGSFPGIPSCGNCPFVPSISLELSGFYEFLN
jgi:hypothetical protein